MKKYEGYEIFAKKYRIIVFKSIQAHLTEERI